jgi:hypothetical protein
MSSVVLEKGPQMAGQRQPNSDHLDNLFGDSAADAQQVLTCIDSPPHCEWSVDQLIDSTGLGVVEIMMIVARLTYAGLVDHSVGGGYRSIRSGLSRTA